MGTISPSTFTVQGHNFTPSGSVIIQVMDSSGSVTGSVTLTAMSNGYFSSNVDSTLIESLGTSAGFYTGSINALDQTTGAATASVPISLTVGAYAANPHISYTGSDSSAVLSGTGFTPNGLVGIYTITTSGTAQTWVDNIYADTYGNFSTHIYGAYGYIAYDNGSSKWSNWV